MSWGVTRDGPLEQKPKYAELSHALSTTIRITDWKTRDIASLDPDIESTPDMITRAFDVKCCVRGVLHMDTTNSGKLANQTGGDPLGRVTVSRK